MAEPLSEPGFRFFDPDSDVAVTERRLPHWAQAGTLCFLTWRTWDSIPNSALREWVLDRAAWLTRLGIDPADERWRDRVSALPRRSGPSSTGSSRAAGTTCSTPAAATACSAGRNSPG